MSVHIEAALKGIVQQAAGDARKTWDPWDRNHFRIYVESCVAAETAELRREIAELKLANHLLSAEIAQLKPTVMN